MAEIELSVLGRQCLMHCQSRLCAMSYSSPHETSNLRTFVFGRGPRGFGSRATLQRRFRPAPKPDTSGEFSRGVPAQERSLRVFGMRLPERRSETPSTALTSAAWVLWWPAPRAPGEPRPPSTRRAPSAVAGDAAPLPEGVRQGQHESLDS